MTKSLRFKILLIFSMLLLISCLLISMFFYQSSFQLVKDSVGKQESRIVEQAVLMIDIGRYEKITLDSGENEYYRELRDRLNNLREMNGMTYLYTMAREKNGDTYDYYYVVDGMPLDSDDASALGEKEEMIDYYPELKRVFETGETEYQLSNDEEYGALISIYTPIKNQSGEVIGIVGADMDATQVYQVMDKNKLNIILITLAILTVGLIVVYLFSVYLTKPLMTLTSQIKKVGKGDLTVAFQSQRKDEIGVLTQAFQHMLAELKSVIQGIQVISGQLTGTSHLLLKNSEWAGKASNEIAASMAEISEGSYTQYRSSEEGAATLEQMSHGLQNIAESSANVSNLSSISSEHAHAGNQCIEKAIEQMNVINQSVERSSFDIKTLENQSNEISSIINIIRDISSQTNLLALNAAIEAARAGESGRGFAVVAEEVRKLAEQSEKSANSISALITKMNEDTKQTVSSMNVVAENVKEGIEVVSEAGKSFASIVESIQSVASHMKEVSVTSEELSAFSEEVTAAVMETTAIASKAAESTKHAAEQTAEQEGYITNISGNISELTDMANQLDLLVKKFTI
jgi:methyl-accepting chemotaxis protein